MKKIYLILLLMVIGVMCFAQTPKFYKVNSNNLQVNKFIPIPTKEENNTYIAEDNYKLPLGRFHMTNGNFMVRAEGDTKAEDAGAFVYALPISEEGDYTIDISLVNVGTDVTGGDGGYLQCIRQSNNSFTTVFDLNIPISGTGEKVGNKVSGGLLKGDIIYLIFTANIDGYGDQFEGKLKITNNKSVLESEKITPLNDFLFYRTITQSPKISDFVPMKQGEDNGIFFTLERYTLPSVEFDKSKYKFSVRAEGDQLVKDKKGAIIGVWTCPESGNYILSTKINNVGLDVCGGDGGGFSLYKGSDKSEYLSALIYSLPIGISEKGKDIITSKEKIVKLNKGDKLFYKWTAGIDAYADLFISDIKIEKTDKVGEEIIDNGLESYLPTLPENKLVSPLKIQDGVWMGCGLVEGTFKDFSSNLWKKYFNKCSVTPVCDDPSVLSDDMKAYMKYYNGKGFPVIPQSWGPSFLPYLIFNNGLETLWDGQYLGDIQVDANYQDGRISSHDLAMHSNASYKAFSKFVESAIQNGGAGSGYCDFTFGWMTYADMGFNSETLDYMRLCLQGKDKGFYVNMNGSKKLIKFKDYCEYYFGGMPTTEDLGLSSPNEYMPVTKEEWIKASDKSVFDQRFMLYDMLTSYLWLSFNNMLGETAIKNGGGFSTMPNPEWFRGSEDFLFGAGLTNVFGIWEEYFQSPGYLDGVYNHYPYFKKSTNGAKVGIVMECGHGGNGNIYYSTPDAFLNAYELTASCNADYIETDFWPNYKGDYENVLSNHAYVNKMRNLLSYGMGFDFAKSDKVKRLQGDFTVISSRRHIRIFNEEWQPWSWCLNTNPFTPEVGLNENGYSFTGISQEGVPYLHSETVLWAADKIVKRNFDSFLAKIKKGEIKNAILMAPACTKVINEKMEVVDFDSLYSFLEITNTNGKWDSVGEEFIPGVKKLKYGSGYIYIVLTPEYNKDLYNNLLTSMNIYSNWNSQDGSVGRIYVNDKMKVIGVQSPEGRSADVFGKESNKSDYGYLAYKSDKEHSINVKFKPNQELIVFSFPTGETKKITCDGEGYAKLDFGVQHILFYCVDPSNENQLESVKKNLDKYLEAMTLEGNVAFNLLENYY